MRISILSAGAWGTAMAVALARKHQVCLWARNPVLIAAITEQHENRQYLPGIAVQLSKLTSNFATAVEFAELVVIASPLAGFRTLLQQLVLARPQVDCIWLCKGFERGSGLLPQQIVSEVLQNNYTNSPAIRTAVLSGPSFALEVAQHLPTALVLASEDEAFAQHLVEHLHDDLMRLYLSYDIIGVEIGGAVKNVMAIAAGVCDGLCLGNNARAALITRGLAEMARLGVKLGAKAETFMGLSGLGDLLLTCGGDLSRNRQVGLKLASGQSLKSILDNLHHVAEGVNTAFEVDKLAAKYQVDMPISSTVCRLLAGEISARDGLQTLLARDYKVEH